MRVSAPTTFRYVLSTALLVVFALYSTLFCIFAYRARHELFLPMYIGACGIALLGMIGMLFPNQEHDWVTCARVCQHVVQITCLLYLDVLLDRWLSVAQNCLRQLMLPFPLRHPKFRWIFALISLALAYWDPNGVVLPCLLVAGALGCSERLGGHMSDAQLMKDVHPNGTYSLELKPKIRDALEFTAQKLIHAVLLLGASNGAYLCVHLVFVYRPKLGDLDLQYIGFFLANLLGSIPFLTMLAMPSYMRRLDVLLGHI